MDLSRSVRVFCAAPWTVETSELEIRIRDASRVRMVIPSLHGKGQDSVRR